MKKTYNKKREQYWCKFCQCTFTSRYLTSEEAHNEHEKQSSCRYQQVKFLNPRDLNSLLSSSAKNHDDYAGNDNFVDDEETKSAKTDNKKRQQYWCNNNITKCF